MIRRARLLLWLLLASVLAAAGCRTPAPHQPVAIAARTTLDEQAALAVELAYQAAATAALTARRAGLVPAGAARCVAALDRRAYAAVLAARAAYDAGNAPDYRSALVQARAAVAGLIGRTGC